MKKHAKTVFALVVTGVTIAAFAYYLKQHPEVINRLLTLPAGVLMGILLLYGANFIAYALVTRGSLHLYGKTITKLENILFNAYSSLVNFFGPGQSAPAFRAIYLKKRHNLRVKHFVFTTLLYYGFFGVLNIVLVAAGSRPWWQTAGLALLGTIGSMVIIVWYKRRSRLGGEAQLTIANVAWIGLATAAQVVVTAGIYALELHSIDASLSWAQIMAYTGVANLTLFVALTPGGIGIRESFLLFSGSLHHIHNPTIVAASIIDRGVYLVFLGILFLMVMSVHAKDKLLPKEQP